MNNALKLLSTLVVVGLSGWLPPMAAPARAEPEKSSSQWLSIGVPAYLRNGGTGASGSEDDGAPLSMNYEMGRFSVGGGRINPSFGLAWDKSAGLYGMTMAEDPLAPDLLSLSTGLKFDPPGWGSHSLSGRTLLLDGEARQSSPGTRGSALLGGTAAGESDLPSSFDLVLEGGRFPILPDITYRLALINPSNGNAFGENGTGFAAGFATRFDLGHGLSVSPMVEAARLNDAAETGARERERQYWSTSMLTEWRNWNLGFSYTERETEEAEATAVSEYRAQASIGYVFDFGLSADLGWYRFNEENESSDQFGLRFTYPLRTGK